MKKLYFLLIALLTTLAASASKVYFDNSETNWAKVNAYVWGGSVTGQAGWPGNAMTLNADGLYEIEFNGTPANIIFNNGSKQTLDLTFVDGATFNFNGVKGAELKDYLIARFDNAESKWAKVYCYTFNPESLGGWPGKQMTLNSETGLYEVYLQATEAPAAGKVIFNNGSGTQTGDLTLVLGETYTKNGLKSDPDPDYATWYVNLPGDHNSWVDNGVQPGRNPIVTFNVASYSGKFRVKVWNGSTDLVYSTKGEIAANEWVTLPLIEGTVDDLGYEDMWLPEGADGQPVTFKFNVETNQLYAEVELKQVIPTAYSVSYDNGLTAWNEVYAYVFNGEKYVAAWPGVKMTAPAEGTVWTYDFETTIDPAYIVFNEGVDGGAQTEDLAFEAGKVYGDPAPIVEEEVLVKWDNNDANYTNPYANWSTEINGTVTSVPMTELIAEVETPDVPEPEQKVVTYNFSEFPAGDYTAETKEGDMTIYASESAKISIDGSNKTIEDVAYTQRLKFGGTASMKNGVPSRVIGFPVDGDCTIVVAATSSSGSEERTVNVYDAAGNVLQAIAAPAGDINVASVEYTGEAGEIFIGSAKSGSNIYFVRVEYPVAAATPAAIEYVHTGIWTAQLPEEAKYVYFTDGASEERGDNKLFAVEDEKTYTPETEAVTGVEAVTIDANAPAVYYNLQGVRVANPAAGQVYIKVIGKNASKVQF